MIESSILLVVALFLPVLAAGLTNLFGAKRTLRDIALVTCGAALCLAIFYLGKRLMLGEVISAQFFELIPGIRIAFKLEPLGLIYAGVASLLWLVTIVYASGYLQRSKDQKQPRFFIYLSVSISAALAIAFSANLLTMFIFYELLTLLTYPLVAHKGDYKSVTAGRKYLAYLVGTSVALFLPAIIAVYHYAGSVDFVESGILNAELPKWVEITLLLAFLYGIGKSAVMPLHSWLPSAMAAPTPVSALLHAVAVVKAGIFCFAKVIIYIFGTESLGLDVTQYVSYIAGFTIVAAGIMALRHDSLKLRLAYSTVAQLSYVILAVSLLNPDAIAAAGTHIAAHAVAKITLFFVAGALIICAGANNVSELNGIGRKVPLLMICFLICTLSLMGLPYLAGGESKQLLEQGAKLAKADWVIYVMYASTLLSALYLLPVSFRAFFRPAASASKVTVPWMMVGAILFTTALTAGFTLYSSLLTELTQRL